MRKHYIKFIQRLIPKMISILGDKSAAKLIKIIIRSFCRLMFMIDASTRQKEQVTLSGALSKYMIKQLSTQMSQTALTPGNDLDDLDSVYKDLPEKKIKNDNEIITIITGFKAILKQLMRYDEPDQFVEETPGEERKTSVTAVVQ